MHIYGFVVEDATSPQWGFQINASCGENNGAPVFCGSFLKLQELVCLRLGALRPEIVTFVGQLPKSLNGMRKRLGEKLRPLPQRERSELLMVLEQVMFPKRIWQDSEREEETEID